MSKFFVAFAFLGVVAAIFFIAQLYLGAEGSMGYARASSVAVVAFVLAGIAGVRAVMLSIAAYQRSLTRTLALNHSQMNSLQSEVSSQALTARETLANQANAMKEIHRSVQEVYAAVQSFERAMTVSLGTTNRNITRVYAELQTGIPQHETDESHAEKLSRFEHSMFHLLTSQRRLEFEVVGNRGTVDAE